MAVGSGPTPPEPLDPEALREIVEGTAGETGGAFFDELVRHLARALGTKCAWVAEWIEATRRLRALSFWVGDRYFGDFEYDVADTPCATVIGERRLIHIPDRLLELYAGDPTLRPLGAVSYMGVPLLETDGRILGHLAVLHDQPLAENPRASAIFTIFAGRAAAELRRLVRDRELAELAHQTASLRAEIDALQGFEEIVGESRSLRAVLADVERVAGGDTTVLILGETGTGKELIARAVQRRSARAGKPLVSVNCAAIPASLQESEFFGHERGAFTGATQRRDGRFKLAHGGTIFLDEVGELPLDLQAKLLRVLQLGEFEPVGSSRSVKVDVRVIAATNRDLRSLVALGRFREDLFYRLNVFPLRLPPLREREDDVALLAESFARSLARKRGGTAATLTETDKARLRRYDWPGNVRELQNVIERALITSLDGRRLNLDRALPETASREARPAEAPAAGTERILTAAELREIERDNLRRALEASGGRIAGTGGAAERIGIAPSTLASRLKALGIERPR